jgi:hypothetical protein
MLIPRLVVDLAVDAREERQHDAGRPVERFLQLGGAAAEDDGGDQHGQVAPNERSRHRAGVVARRTHAGRLHPASEAPLAVCDRQIAEVEALHFPAAARQRRGEVGLHDRDRLVAGEGAVQDHGTHSSLL